MIVFYEWWGVDGVGMVCSIDFDVDGNFIFVIYFVGINLSDQFLVVDFFLELFSDGQVQFMDVFINMFVSWVWDFGDGSMGVG